MTKVNNIKVFASQNEFFDWSEEFEECADYQYIPTAVVDSNKQKISCDMLTSCKSWKTALRRFEKTFKEICPTITEWVETMRDTAIEEKRFSLRSSEDEIPGNMYAWGIEWIDENEWYIFLNLQGVFAGYEMEETAEEIETTESSAGEETTEATEEKEGATMAAKTQYKEIRKISASSLRKLCIKYDWYTLGDNDEYGHLLFDLAQNKENLTTGDIIAIAQDIVEHSEKYPDNTVENVASEVVRITRSYFENF